MRARARGIISRWRIDPPARWGAYELKLILCGDSTVWLGSDSDNRDAE